MPDSLSCFLIRRRSVAAGGDGQPGTGNGAVAPLTWREGCFNFASVAWGLFSPRFFKRGGGGEWEEKVIFLVYFKSFPTQPFTGLGFCQQQGAGKSAFTPSPKKDLWGDMPSFLPHLLLYTSTHGNRREVVLRTREEKKLFESHSPLTLAELITHSWRSLPHRGVVPWYSPDCRPP